MRVRNIVQNQLEPAAEFADRLNEIIAKLEAECPTSMFDVSMCSAADGRMTATIKEQDLIGMLARIDIAKLFEFQMAVQDKFENMRIEHVKNQAQKFASENKKNSRKP